MKALAFIAIGVAATIIQPIEARLDSGGGGSRPRPAREPSYLLMDAGSGRLIHARWDDPHRPLPMGSLIKPFTALAYAEGHRLTFPSFVCRGTIDSCWLPAGHGRVGIAAAIGESCNAYFRQLSLRTSPDGLVSTLRWFGMRASVADVTSASMVGFGEDLQLTPVAIARAYLELVARSSQPGVSPIVEGMALSARAGTGRAIGAAMGQAGALTKTGTAPCVHSPRASADGYAVVIYPADRPRVALLVQAHGRTGAETAGVAAVLLRDAVEVR